MGIILEGKCFHSFQPAWVFPYCCIFFYFILISISNSFILKLCQLSSPVLTCLCLHGLLLKMNETSKKTLQCLQFVSSYRSFIQYSAIQYITMWSIAVFPVNRAVTAASVSVPSIQGNGCIFYVSCVFVSACMKPPPDVFCEEEEAFLCRWHLNKTQNI